MGALKQVENRCLVARKILNENFNEQRVVATYDNLPHATHAYAGRPKVNGEQVQNVEQRLKQCTTRSGPKRPDFDWVGVWWVSFKSMWRTGE